MLSKLRAFASLYRELGPRWTLFRLAYAFRLRTGIIRLQMPMGEWDTSRAERSASAVEAPLPEQPAGRDVRWLSSPAALRGTYRNSQFPWDKQTAIEEADKILNGELKYFSRQFIKTGFPPDWHKDYFSHVILSASASSPKEEGSLSSHSEILRSQQPLPQNDTKKHWSQIPHDAAADIKFVWEPNRFAFVYTLVRAYAASQDEKYPEAFWTLIEDWAKRNPPNTGPNWMDGQEIALRLMAWTYGFFQFSNSPSSTPQRIENFKIYVAAQAERIYKNIGYAISTRSNHTISEAFGLWMVGLLFPDFKHAEKYLSLGKRILEREAAAQIFPDGSYSMYSLNYHRFILHIYLYAIRLGEINDPLLRRERSSTKQSPTAITNAQRERRLLRPFGSRNDGAGWGIENEMRFSDSVYKAVANSITYLSHLIDPATGQMPVYGSNDGALVLPLNNCDFTDYRPLLQLGWYITRGEFLFEPGPWDEDVFWICGVSRAERSRSDSGGAVEAPLSKISFPHGGIYLLRQANSRAIIRCTDFTSRPSHADQLHVDLWLGSNNIAIDAGTYLYSGAGIWRNGLARTSVHNTVTVDGKDQMTMLSRFTWTNWSKGKVLKHTDTLWQGEHNGYQPVSHRRTVMALEGDRWLVMDELNAKEAHHYALHWLLNDFPFEWKDNSVLLSVNGMKYKAQVGLADGKAKFTILRADPNSAYGWRSRYYSHKEPAISLLLEANLPRARFWTFFGFEKDDVEVSGEVLRVHGKDINPGLP